ncbi:MAG: FtsW/RodA/SpoVE family cell cycle protein, partial [Alkalibacterium sp.]
FVPKIISAAVMSFFVQGEKTAMGMSYASNMISQAFTAGILVIMMIAFHVLENIGMNIGLLPVTGIPLPFVSQGGSSLLGNMMGVGLIMSMRFHHKSYFFSGEGEDFHPGT